MATSYLLETMYALTAYNATILYATTAPVFPESRIVENRPRRVRHVLATILLQQIDRPLLAEQRALLNEPKPRAPRIARDLQHIADPLQDRKTVVEGKSVSLRVDPGGRRII